jgi:hypothetical protein
MHHNYLKILICKTHLQVNTHLNVKINFKTTFKVWMANKASQFTSPRLKNNLNLRFLLIRFDLISKLGD